MITVRQGSRGDAVRQLQELLGITADGIFRRLILNGRTPVA